MGKCLSIMLLGIVIYGAVFHLKMSGYQEGFKLVNASVEFEAKEPLTFVDGIHNGFAALGNVVSSFFRFVLVNVVGTWNYIVNPSYDSGWIGWFFMSIFAIFMAFVMAVVAIVIHIGFYVGLLFKLLFVAASPTYHLGLLLGLGVTWCIMAAGRAAEGEPTATE